MFSAGGGWIVCRLVFENRKVVRPTIITFAKDLNGHKAAKTPLGQP